MGGLAELSGLSEEEIRALNAAQNLPTIGTTTNDEYRAAKLAQDAKAAEEAAYWDALRGTEDDPFRFNPRFNDELSYQTDADGNFGLGLIPEGGLYYNDYSGTMVPTPPAPPVAGSSDLTLGGSTSDVETAYEEPVPGQEYQDPFEPPTNYDPSGGNGLPNGGIPLDYQGWTGSQPVQGVDYAGIGVEGTQPIGGLEDLMAQLTPEKTGYESSSNKDFYQKQFQDMRTQEAGNDMREWAAAIKAQEAAAAPQGEAFGGDPWSWTTLPQVMTGGTVAATPVEWGLNPDFAWGDDVTNQQILQDINPRLSESEQLYLNKNPLTDAPSFTDQTAFRDFINTDHPNDKGYTSVLNKIYNNVWQATGGNEGGIAVPEGYANPINTQGA